MKYIFYIIITVLPCMLYAQEQKDNNSLLWQISGKEMKQPSYLFGTVHIICDDKYVWTDAMKKRLALADEVCMEMDMDDPAIFMQIASGMAAPEGKMLSDYFSKEDFNLLKNYFRDTLGINIAAFMGMKPIVLQTLFIGNTVSVSCDSLISYEVKIAEAASKSGKEITGLESAEEQIQLLDNIPIDSVVAELMRVVRGEAYESSELDNLMTAYQNQDIEAVYQFILTEDIPGDDLNIFIDERNQKWIERMTERMEQKPIFFAVGAGHLWGDKGLISLLRKEGYTVEPVR